MSNALTAAFRHALSSNRQQWITPYTPSAGDDRHQFVLFLKPEVTSFERGVDVEAVIALVHERLEAFGVTLHAARVLPAPYLAAHAVMDRHYGVINRISKLGEEALTDSARVVLRERFAADLAAGATVLGGHQFLAAYPDFSPLALCTLSDNLGTTKLGGGSYCLRVNVQGQVCLVLNPFHAWQLVPFTTSGHAILVYECRASRPWRSLRTELTGATNPAKALPGSIRAELLARKEQLGLRDVNQGSNGVHLSAGPLEGMVEVQRFFSDPEAHHEIAWADTTFGRQLLAAGLDPAALATNPTLTRQGASVSAFDLTEERDAAEAIGLLA